MLSKPLQENIDLIEMGKYLKKLKWDKEDLEHAKKYIEQIAFLSEEKFMSQDFKGLDEFEYFIANNNKILIPTIGQYSSGKSSLLNILIGNHYLPTSDGVCTNKGVIIEYTPDKNIAELYEIKLNIERKYFSFVKSKKICDDKKKIEGEIDKINKEHKAIKLEDSFLLLKVHIEFFELLEEEFREKILLIDFPGLGVLKNKNFFSSDVLGPLINQSDSFLFFNPEVVNSDENQQIIINIVERIKNRKISFSYKNCLFIMNKWDKHRASEKNYTLEQAKNDLKKIFYINNLEDIFQDIDMINCSASDYKAFLKIKNLVLNFEDYLKRLEDDFENEYEDNEHEEDEDKSEEFYKYIKNDITAKKDKLTIINEIDLNKKEEYFEKLNNFLSNSDYNIKDSHKNDIIDSYLILINNIKHHTLLISSNKENLEKKIKQHILLAVSNLKNTIELKGINFLRSINETISFVLDRLNSPMKNKLEYSKIEESENRKKEIEEMFSQFKILIEIAKSKFIGEQDQLINNYIREVSKIFINRKKENENKSNKIILGQIENEKLDELKDKKKKFYQTLKQDFENFIKETEKKMKDIKYELKIDENNFSQLYFQTSEYDANNINNSPFWKFVKDLASFFSTKWSEYILHSKILYDDKETIINKSIENFKLVKKQNKENLKDYLTVYNERLDEFENNVKNEVQKMIDLSYSDYTKFKDDSKIIIKNSTNEFYEYLKKKYNESNIIK